MRHSPYTCAYCGNKYSMRRTLVKHISYVHSVKSIPEVLLTPPIFVENTLSKTPKRVCEPVNILPPRKPSNNNENVNSNYPLASSILNDNINKEPHQFYEQVNKDPSFKCNKCDKTFISRYWFEFHQKMHTLGNCFNCDCCSNCYECNQHIFNQIRSAFPAIVKPSTSTVLQENVLSKNHVSCLKQGCEQGNILPCTNNDVINNDCDIDIVEEKPVYIEL